MKNIKALYWWFQVGGWLFYALTLVFFANIFDQQMTEIINKRLALAILLGFSFTHILRFFILRFKLLPPLYGNQWLYLVLLILSICTVFSYLNSTLVEYFEWYDPKIKATVEKRFLYNMMNDSPIILVWVSIYYLWHYIQSFSKTELDRVRLQSMVKELELKTIKSHINPHFIFNALNSIRALVDENPERARKAITELSNILRSSMQAEKLETASLEKELGIVQDYLELEQIRFEDRLRVEYDIDDDTLDQQIPPMMLQTLVENAIKHGISRQVLGGVVRVVSDFRDNHHELIVQNTGNLVSQANKDGFGISGTISRLRLLYGEKADFHIKNINGNMVEARVILPLSTS